MTDLTTIINDVLGTLSDNVLVVIPVALGLSAVVFGAGWLWNKVKGLVS
jgi:hypothetical protein